MSYLYHLKNYLVFENPKWVLFDQSNLYKLLRAIKMKGYRKIQIARIPNKGSGIAINDRIKRASKN